MADEINSISIQVVPEHLACAVGSGDLDVLATPMMIAAMEQAACGLLARFLDPGQTSVGTAIGIKHTAATPCGMAYTASARLTGREGRCASFEVWAEDEIGEIGRGSHTRVVVDAKRFQEKADAKRRLNQ